MTIFNAKTQRRKDAKILRGIHSRELYPWRDFLQMRGDSPVSLIIHDDPVPLRVLENGQVRVGKTRVMLELVILAYREGCTPERIVEDYSSLDLADVHAVIAYYLRHRAEVDAYVEQEIAEGYEIR